MAEAAGDALNRLLREGGVTIFNIGPDKYPGRVVADVATKRTPSVSAALLGSASWPLLRSLLLSFILPLIGLFTRRCWRCAAKTSKRR